MREAVGQAITLFRKFSRSKVTICNILLVAKKSKQGRFDAVQTKLQQGNIMIGGTARGMPITHTPPIATNSRHHCTIVCLAG